MNLLVRGVEAEGGHVRPVPVHPTSKLDALNSSMLRSQRKLVVASSAARSGGWLAARQIACANCELPSWCVPLALTR
jgi:hypothetical protein